MAEGVPPSSGRRVRFFVPHAMPVDMRELPFRDRKDAGEQLAQALLDRRGEDVLVLGMARGGVPVAFEVARALDAELDCLVVRKLGAPGRPEFGFGAIALRAEYLDA